MTGQQKSTATAVTSAEGRVRVMDVLLKKAENATDFPELKSIVVDLCRVVSAQVEAERSGQFD